MPASHELLTTGTERGAAGLIWARLGRRGPFHHVWFGFGLLSNLGLPLDSLQMFLAAKRLYSEGADARPVTVLLADAHALSNGADLDSVSRRAATRAAEIRDIAAVIHLPVTIQLASALDGDAQFQDALLRAEEICGRDGEVRHRYTIRGVADVLHYCRGGGVKVGWTHSADLVPGRGRHHEFETDALAYLVEPNSAAAYVRHGVTLDSSRPVAVPYTEMAATTSRLMLTGPDRGCYREKLSAPTVSAKRRQSVLSHLAVTVEAFEDLVAPLSGGDLIEKAEGLLELFTTP